MAPLTLETHVNHSEHSSLSAILKEVIKANPDLVNHLESIAAEVAEGSVAVVGKYITNPVERIVVTELLKHALPAVLDSLKQGA